MFIGLVRVWRRRLENLDSYTNRKFECYDEEFERSRERKSGDRFPYLCFSAALEVRVVDASKQNEKPTLNKFLYNVILNRKPQ